MHQKTIDNTESRSIARRAAAVRPTRQQLAWQEMEVTTFIHWGMPTFYEEQDWGLGTEAPSFFNPTGFDPEQWVETAKLTGSSLLILTAKHHDGFCLWPTRTTDHNITHSPFGDGRIDIVKETAAACRRGGIKFGLYLSPWDRHEPCYGTPAYNDFFMAQLRELCTNYGEIAEFWFDGACGEGKWGKYQHYDWPAYFKLIRELQPNALIANQGPDVRWGGNEGGVARGDEWSVYGLNTEPDQFRNWHAVTDAAKFDPHTDGMTSLGVKPVADLATLAERSQLFWSPVEIDYSLRMYWFWHPNHECVVRTTEQLMETHYKSVGRNGVLLLGLSPDRAGRIPDFDVERLSEWRSELDKTFADDKAKGAGVDVDIDGSRAETITDERNDTYWKAANAEPATVELWFDKPVTFNRVCLQEMIAEGQQVEKWRFQVRFDGDRWVTMAGGGAIGHKRLFKLGTVTTGAVRLQITEVRGAPTLRHIGLFQATGG